MKIALAGMSHESNTFNKIKTELEAFDLTEGEVFLQQGRSDSSASGLYETLTADGADVAPLFFARAIPSGTVKRDAYDYIKSHILEKLQSRGPWDAVCLALHGSMLAEGVYDPEGNLLEAVRSIVGFDIPIVCTLDMHATVTERMSMLSDGYAVFRTAPHIDAFETGERAANILLEILKHKKRTVNILIKIPILVSGEQSETNTDPAKTLFESLKEYDKLPNVLCASYVMGFPWADNPFGGAGVLITGWADSHDALKELANEMAVVFWDKRADFVYSTPAMQPEQAIEAALSATQFPVIISDSADNPTAGASQDTTGFLRLMIDSGVQNAVYTCIADSEAYTLCSLHAVGDLFMLSFGGRSSGQESERYTIIVKLLNLAVLQGIKYAVLDANGVKFLISNRRCATYFPETLKDLGLEPSSFNLIGIKAGYLSPAYKKISKMSILALTDGDTALELVTLPYVNTPRPIYPLDLDMNFDIISQKEHLYK
jgi:microcystin degradation protein MlrC